MKGFIFLVVNLAVSSAFRSKNGPVIVEIGEDKDIIDANKGKGSMHDDIIEPPNKQRSAVNAKYRLWTLPVPYVLDKDLEMNAKGVILRSLDQFRLKSCIDFKPRDSEDYYLLVQKLDGCYSYIGEAQESGGQTLSIGMFCDEVSTVEHEFLHALGFFHEQSRFDRDDYVTIKYDNIEEGFEYNFRKVSNETSTTNGVPYDYWSVMHYGGYAFSNGNGSTIITNDAKFQDVIGQRLEMSPSDVLELNLLYECDSTVAFKMHCDFSHGKMCQMNHCSKSGLDWEMVTHVTGGPSSDHTSLPSGSGDHGQDAGYFMHASTSWGQEGDSAWLETHRMSPNRECHVQCLQFYFFSSGNELDHLNIWIREFQDEWDSVGTMHLMEQITGKRTSHWTLKHVSLHATKHFQVEFEVRKGAGHSSGGFSIDDINLSEIECPHVTMQLNDFENLLNTSDYETIIFSTPQYSREGYAYRVGTVLSKTYVGLFAQLLSGKYDDQLEWPCPQRQVTFQMLDQNPNIQLQMSKQRSITSDRSTDDDGSYMWGNPREVGTPYVEENNETIFGGPLLGRLYFSSVDDFKSRDFLKGGSAVFVFSFQDLTPLVNGSVLPCPHVRPMKITHPARDLNKGPCSSGISTTTLRPPITGPVTPPKTTDDDRTTTTTLPPPTTGSVTPPTTTDDSIFGSSAGLMCSPVVTLLLALMLLIP